VEAAQHFGCGAPRLRFSASRFRRDRFDIAKTQFEVQHCPASVQIGPSVAKEEYMSLIRWDPFSDVDTMFGRLVPSNIANWTRLGVEGNGRKLDWAPSADISETDKEYVIRAELPAVKKEDVQVTLDDGMITIRGERKQQKEDKNEKFHRVESFYGTFERRFSLPENVNADSIRCESKEGILTVHIPKTETAKQKPKQITVQ